MTMHYPAARLFRIFALTALAFCGVRLPAIGQPADTTAKLVSELVVRVRTTDTQSKQELNAGCGLIVGSDDDSLTILTARHVIEKAMSDAAPISVLFPGSDIWCDAELGAALAGAETVDAAFIRVKRSLTPLKGTPRSASLVVSPAPAKDADIYAYGLDPGKDEFTWCPGVFGKVDAGVATFDAKNVVKGFSGGVLISEVGVIGLTVNTGPDGAGHEALLLAPLLELVKAKDGAVLIESSPVLSALGRLSSGKLVAALDVWNLNDRGGKGQSFWVSLVPSERIGDRFTFNAITPRGQTTAEAVAVGPGLSMTIASKLEGLAKAGAVLERGTYRMDIDPEVLIPGFLVLKGKSDKSTLYLALPTASVEMVVARAFKTGFAPVGDDTEDTIRLERLPKLDGKAMPFSTAVCLECPLDFAIPGANHRQKSVGVAGTFFLPDGAPTTKPQHQATRDAVGKTLRFVAMERGKNDEVSGVAFPWPHGEFAFTLPPTDKTMRLGFAASDKEQRQWVKGSFLFAQGLRLEYGE